MAVIIVSIKASILNKAVIKFSVVICLRTKVLHGCCKPAFITLGLYTNLTLPVTELFFHKELSSEKILEKRPPTMT